MRKDSPSVTVLLLCKFAVHMRRTYIQWYNEANHTVYGFASNTKMNGTHENKHEWRENTNDKNIFYGTVRACAVQSTAMALRSPRHDGRRRCDTQLWRVVAMGLRQLFPRPPTIPVLAPAALAQFVPVGSFGVGVDLAGIEAPYVILL